jgi:ribosomal protein L25 (general stress protein Ctc)
MEKVILKAEKRELTGKQVKVLRREGKLPAVIYGKGIESTPIVLDRKETTTKLGKVSSSTILTIDLAGKEHPRCERNPEGFHQKRNHPHRFPGSLIERKIAHCRQH